MEVDTLDTPFVTGQRWLSEAEPELGLGTVLEVDLRQVRIRFGACELDRVYAVRTAPLARIRLTVGDRLEDRLGRHMEVLEVQDIRGLLAYRCRDLDQQECVVIEAELSDRMHVNRPQDRLLACRLDRDIWFDLRRRAWDAGARLTASGVAGLSGPRVALIPHQLYIADEVSRRAAPRVLLADEVGLGKTIEAGLIMHRLLLAERARRVLVVVPESLQYQWLVEMQRRFNVRFALFDAERLEPQDNDDAEGEDENPFHGEQRVICSLELLTGSPRVARAVLEGEWDLLVVDEAHHLGWSEGEPSLEYALIEALAQHIPSVLLLTATPEQLGRVGHFARLRLLDPHRFHDYQAFLDEEQRYAPVAALANELLGDEVLSPAASAVLRDLLGDAADQRPRTELIDELLDRHGTGRVLFRNTRQAIQGFPGREPVAHPLVLPEAYRAVAARIDPEQGFGPGWERVDPRVEWLLALLGELAPRKVLVICAHAETAIDLRDYLVGRAAVRTAVFHEHMPIIDRDRAAAYFAAEEDGAQVLVCSEIGSEGRNFQFAHHLVLFDLPLQPDLLEQRIGRLDRIGQRERIRIHVPYLQGGAGERLYRWYHEGLDAFSATRPAANAVYAELGVELHAQLATGNDMDDLLVRAQQVASRINHELEAGRDRLLELSSHRPLRAQTLHELIDELDYDPELERFMGQFWDAFGVDHEAGVGGSVVLRRGSHMLHADYPGLDEDGAHATFRRNDALAHEDREFLTWEHPMVEASLDMLAGSGLGAAAVTVITHPDFPSASVFLEMLYVAECAAPGGLELERFLPPTCIRLVVDAQGRERSEELPADHLHGLCLSKNRRLAETVVRSQGARLKAMFVRGEELAQPAGNALVAQARARMREELDAEYARLSYLATVNPSVRPDELEQLQTRRAAIDSYLDHTRVRLDAARVVVVR